MIVGDQKPKALKETAKMLLYQVVKQRSQGSPRQTRLFHSHSRIES